MRFSSPHGIAHEIWKNTKVTPKLKPKIKNDEFSVHGVGIVLLIKYLIIYSFTIWINVVGTEPTWLFVEDG